MQKKQNHISLRTQILANSILPLSIVSILLCIAFISIINSSIKNNISELAKTSVEKLSYQVETILSPSVEMVSDVAAVASKQSKRDVMFSTVKALSKDRPEAFAVYYATAISRYEKDGFYVDSSDWDPEPDWIPPNKPWYKAALKDKTKIAFTEPYVDSMTFQTCITLSHAVVNDNDKLIGVAAADITVDALAEAVKDVKISENSKMYLIDSTGLYITNENVESIMTKNYFENSKLTEKGYSKENYLTNESKIILDGSTFYAVAPAENTPWFIVAEGPVSDFTSQFYSALKAIMIILLVVIL